MTINDQIRDAIRRRFRVGEQFTIHDLRRRAPELCHVTSLSERLARIASAGFISVLRRGKPGIGSTSVLYVRVPKPNRTSEGGLTVTDWMEAWVVEPSDDWRERIADVCNSIGMSPRDYLRDLIESDIARRSAIARARV